MRQGPGAFARVTNPRFIDSGNDRKENDHEEEPEEADPPPGDPPLPRGERDPGSRGRSDRTDLRIPVLRDLHRLPVRPRLGQLFVQFYLHEVGRASPPRPAGAPGARLSPWES